MLLASQPGRMHRNDGMEMGRGIFSDDNCFKSLDFEVLGLEHDSLFDFKIILSWIGS